VDFPDIQKRLLRPMTAPTGRSAVLMLFTTIQKEPHIVFTLRSDQLSSHPGELSLPGGRVETPDADTEAAALRETFEETGIRPQDVERWGHVSDYTTFRTERLSVFAAHVDASKIPDPTPANEEVHRILLIPLESLRAAAPRGDEEHPHPDAERLGRRVHACDVEGYYAQELLGRVIHYWPLQDGHVLWGITGDLVAMTLQRLFDWVPPSKPRRVQNRDDVRPRSSSEKPVGR
jgi:8-oxo-dGTP pyrophosphatase MutT (NUDIX family)